MGQTVSTIAILFSSSTVHGAMLPVQCTSTPSLKMVCRGTPSSYPPAKVVTCDEIVDQKLNPYYMYTVILKDQDCEEKLWREAMGRMTNPANKVVCATTAACTTDFNYDHLIFDSTLPYVPVGTKPAIPATGV